MKKSCPICGGETIRLRIAWHCPVCGLYIPHPKTNGDTIRAMTDEELADFIAKLMAKQRATIIENLRAKGLIVDVGIVEMPEMAKLAHLKWLRETAEEERL